MSAPQAVACCAGSLETCGGAGEHPAFLQLAQAAQRDTSGKENHAEERLPPAGGEAVQPRKLGISRSASPLPWSKG